MRGFKKIKTQGYEFQVSRGGRVIYTDGFHPARELEPVTRSNGYAYVSVPGKSFAVHRLVAQAFYNGGRELNRGMVVHHMNHVRNDNRASNIRLCASRKEHEWYHAMERKYFAWVATTERYATFLETERAAWEAGL